MLYIYCDNLLKYNSKSKYTKDFTRLIYYLVNSASTLILMYES